MAKMLGYEEMPFDAASCQEMTAMGRGEGLPMAAMKCQEYGTNRGRRVAAASCHEMQTFGRNMGIRGAAVR
jgi:hypothetical protein